MKNILEVNDATKVFGGLVANDGVTFNIEEGEIMGMVGPNGAGKTTLFNSISGMHTLSRGSISFNGVEITNKKPHDICRLGIGRTFQIPQTLDDMLVYENVLAGALLRTNSVKIATEKADEVLEECGLMQYRDTHAGKLNVAQKKRLEIARAIATDPKLLLLDETMAGLTATERREAVELIRYFNRKGMTILTIEHNMDVVMSVSNRVVVLVSGKLLMVGTPDEVTTNPKVISAYLGGGTEDESE